MYGYLLLLIFVFISFAAMIIYIVIKTHNVIKDKIKNKTVSWILSFIPIFILGVGIAIDMVNAIVVDVHLFIFLLLSELVLYFIRKNRNISIKPYTSLIIGVLITIVYMGSAYYLAHHVVETDYTVYTTKNIGVDNFRIVQVSDSHLGATMNGKEFSKYMEDINKLNPDVVVLTGDFVDDDTSFEDMVDGASGLGKLKAKHGVYFIYGNHDKGYYNNRSYNDSDIRRELKNNNVTVLEDRAIYLSNNIVLIGRQDAQIQTRRTAVDLTSSIDNNKYIIMLDHEPNDYDNEKNTADLVLLGHTHGGQLVPLGQIAKLLKINDAVYGMGKRGDTTFIINSGISDWAIKFKTGAKAEYTVIDIKNKN